MAGFSRSVKAVVHKDQSKVKYKLVNFRQKVITYDEMGNPHTTVETYRRLYRVNSGEEDK